MEILKKEEIKQKHLSLKNLNKVQKDMSPFDYQYLYYLINDNPRFISDVDLNYESIQINHQFLISFLNSKLKNESNLHKLNEQNDEEIYVIKTPENKQENKNKEKIKNQTKEKINKNGRKKNQGKKIKIKNSPSNRIISTKIMEIKFKNEEQEEEYSQEEQKIINSLPRKKKLKTKAKKSKKNKDEKIIKINIEKKTKKTSKNSNINEEKKENYKCTLFFTTQEENFLLNFQAQTNPEKECTAQESNLFCPQNEIPKNNISIIIQNENEEKNLVNKIGPISTSKIDKEKEKEKGNSQIITQTEPIILNETKIEAQPKEEIIEAKEPEKKMFCLVRYDDYGKVLRKKRGRKSINPKGVHYHSAQDDDNILRKIQVNFLSFITCLTNDFLNCIIPKEKSLRFITIDYEEKKVINHKKLEGLKKKTVGEILQLQPSPKIKKSQNISNEQIYNQVLEQLPLMKPFFDKPFKMAFAEYYYNKTDRNFEILGINVTLSKNVKTFHDLLKKNNGLQSKFRNVCDRYFLSSSLNKKDSENKNGFRFSDEGPCFIINKKAD